MSKPIARSREINFMPDQSWTIECYLDKKKKKNNKKIIRSFYRCFDFDWEGNLFVDKRVKWVPWEINESTWDCFSVVLFHGA